MTDRKAARPLTSRADILLMTGVAALVVVAVVVTFFLFKPGDQAASSLAPPAPTTAPGGAGTPTPTATAAPAFDIHARSIDKASSIWVVADKLRPLNPKTYAPNDLVAVPSSGGNNLMRKEAANAFKTMIAAFHKQTGLNMVNQSAYRSYNEQVAVYGGYVKSMGQKEADRGSARPGFSEHQTGLSTDIAASPANCTLNECFDTTAQYKWLAKNAYKYGFELRYPKGKENVTGYKYEPWHWRYLGTDLALELHNAGNPTLEEFFGLPPAPDYKK